MRTVLRPWVEETLLSTRASERGYFNRATIQRLLAEHMSGANYERKLGVLLSLELWHRQFID
jgi:transposase